MNAGKTLFLAAVAGVVLLTYSPSYAVSAQDAEKFQKTLDELEALQPKKHQHGGRYSKAFKAKLQQVLKAAQVLLDQHGVRWNLDPANSEIILITPLRSGHSMNQTAYGVQKTMRGLEVEYNPKELLGSDASALFEEDRGRLIISADDVQRGEIGSFLQHELRHALLQNRLMNGRDTVFFGFVEAMPGHTIGEAPYNQQFSFDEIAAYSVQIHFLGHELEVARRAGNSDLVNTRAKEIQWAIDVVTPLLNVLEVSIPQALTTIEVMEQSSQTTNPWLGLSKLESVLGDDVDCSGFSNGAAGLFFFRNDVQFKNHKKSVVFANIETGPVRTVVGTVDLGFRNNLKVATDRLKSDGTSVGASDELAPVIRQVRRKMLLLRDRLKDLKQAYADLTLVLRGKRYDDVIERTRSIKHAVVDQPQDLSSYP
ncbi:hypothetical protein K2X30_09885 [bacterium]|jgi:hypothetical protein|nr:hypothetical protein [bacterium]